MNSLYIPFVTVCSILVCSILVGALITSIIYLFVTKITKPNRLATKCETSPTYEYTYIGAVRSYLFIGPCKVYIRAVWNEEVRLIICSFTLSNEDEYEVTYGDSICIGKEIYIITKEEHNIVKFTRYVPTFK